MTVYEFRPPPEGEEVTASSWSPVNLTTVLEGDWQPAQPSIGLRDDGKGLFYPGRDHAVISASEAGKTWFACCAVLDEMQSGNHVVYVDFEDEAAGIVNRLLTMGAKRDLIRSHFHYIRPEAYLYAPDLVTTLDTYAPSLVVLDGVTEGMSMHGLDPLSNKDVAAFRQMLAYRVTARGPAVVSLDHVVKDTEGRGRYALGGVHKLNGLSGAAYILTSRSPFGVGLTGKSTIHIAKDRPGELRRNGLPSSNGMSWYGDLVVKSTGDGFAEVSITPPHQRDENWQPTALMEKIAEALQSADQPLAQRTLLDLVKGKTETKREAFSQLVAAGYISQKTPHTMLKPYDPEAD